MNALYIREFRAFNRFYTQLIGLLDQHILQSQYSLSEVRILYELYHDDQVTASELIRRLDIDKGYLSRILKKFEKQKLLIRCRAAVDHRVVVLGLSVAGKKAFEVLNKASDRQIEKMIRPLAEKECAALMAHFAAIQKILKNTLPHG